MDSQHNTMTEEATRQSEKRDVELQEQDELPISTLPTARQVIGRIVSTNFAFFMAGMNDAATGVLIPYLQPAYNIGLLPVSILYLVNFAGWLSASFTNIHLCSRLGTGGTLVVGAIVQFVGYALMFWKPPFPLYAIAFFFTGMGVAYQDAQSNTFTTAVQNAHRWLGVLHAMYGVGAVVSPLVANTIAARTRYWHYYYLVTLGLGLINICLLAWTFRKGLFKPNVLTAKDTAGKELKGTLTSKAVWILNAFFFLYVGAEVTAGGWVVQFLVSVRGGEPSKVGYVSSGFFTGLTVGRVALADITNKLGERRMVFVYLALSVAMQLMFWFIPNIIANAIVVSFLGFFLGPFYPVGLSVLTKILPKEIHIGAIGFSASTGQAGSAAFPFLTGAVASKAGVKVLQPIMIGLLAGMAICWALVPRQKKNLH